MIKSSMPAIDTATAATDTKSERSFGLTVGAACGIIWMIALWRGRGNPFWLGVLGGLLALLGWAAPATLRLPNAAWNKLSEVLGWINSRVILTAVFFLVFTPAGLIMRLLGRDPLRLRRGKRLTGWETYPARTRGSLHYKRMF